MKMFSSISARLKAHRKHAKEEGFNMLEIVIGVGLILILSAGGIVVFNGITDNAKEASVQSAVSSVFTAAMAYDLDSDASSNIKAAADEFNNSQEKLKIEVSAAKTLTSDTVEVGATLLEDDGTGTLKPSTNAKFTKVISANNKVTDHFADYAAIKAAMG